MRQLFSLSGKNDGRLRKNFQNADKYSQTEIYSIRLLEYHTIVYEIIPYFKQKSCVVEIIQGDDSAAHQGIARSGENIKTTLTAGLLTAVLPFETVPIRLNDLILFEHADAVRTGTNVRRERLAPSHRHDFLGKRRPCQM